MIALIDVGNSVINGALFEEEKKVSTFSFPTIKDADKNYFYNELKREIKGDVKRALISSVCPEVNDHLVNGFEKLHIKARVVNPLGLEHLLKIGLNPKSCLGADIFITSLASIEGDGDSSVVIDMGTATTFGVTVNGTILGGIIIPGVKSSFRAMFKDASLLQEVTFEKPDSIIGRDTPSSINAGMMWGTIGSIEKILAEIKKEYKIKKIYFTGGLGRFFSPFIKGSIYDEDLIFKGLLKIDKYLEKR